MYRVTPSELAEGAARLDVDGSGTAAHPLVVVELDGLTADESRAAAEALVARHTIVVGLSNRPLPSYAMPLLEALDCTLSPGGPGTTWVDAGIGSLDRIAATVGAAPFASLTMSTLLGLTSRSSVADGLVAESMAYSMLLGGPEFKAWRLRTPRAEVPEAETPVLLDRREDALEIRLNRPERHNAFGRAVRDGLLSGLEIASADRSIDAVVVSGNGRSFCSGGDLDEFGTLPDTVAAHQVRLQLSAGYAVHLLRQRLGPRLSFEVHGACIGAGIEVPSFAAHVVAHDDAFFCLPELSMGLVPGAGGTVSLTHRIGRWRTAWLALTGQRLSPETALAWGLVDALA